MLRRVLPVWTTWTHQSSMSVTARRTTNETIWQGICTRTLGTYNRVTAVQVNYVLEEIFTPEVAEQGKGQGSLV